MLVVVVWGVGLMSLLILAFTSNVRTQTQIATNTITTAILEAFADAGVNMAILDLIETGKEFEEEPRFSHQGDPVVCRVSSDTTLKISVQDEEGKVDLNTAPEPLLRALIGELGVNALETSRLVDALLDFRDSDDLRRLNGAEAKDYEMEGVSWRPNDAPFRSADELHRVQGFRPALVNRLLPLVTTFSGRSGFDPTFASRSLLQIFANPGSTEAGAILSSFRLTSKRRFFAIRVEANHRNGSAFIRDATVELRSTPNDGYQFRRWKRGEGVHSSPVQSELFGRGLPSC